MPGIQKYLLAFLLFFVFGELLGRYWGLCDFPLYVESPRYEYAHLPGQDRLVFRNRLRTNDYGLRAAPLELADTTVVLLIGDSVVHGTNFMDDEALASRLLEKRLTDALGRPVRVLPVAFPSWGPDNAVAFLREHGSFGADLACWVVSSHDARDTMRFDAKVGRNPLFPKRQALLAWQKAVSAGWFFVWRRLAGPPQEGRRSDEPSFNSGFAELLHWARRRELPLRGFLHPTTAEIEQGAMDEGGIEIRRFFRQNSIPFQSGLEQGASERFYRDGIHFNAAGQQFLADQLFDPLKAYLQRSSASGTK